MAAPQGGKINVSHVNSRYKENLATPPSGERRTTHHSLLSEPSSEMVRELGLLAGRLACRVVPGAAWWCMCVYLLLVPCLPGWG